MAATGATDEQGQPYMSEAEERNPFAFLMLNQVAHPLFAALPDQMPDLAKGVAAAGSEMAARRAQAAAPAAPAAAAEGGGAEELSALRAQLAELRETVQSQQAKIEELDGRLREKQ